MTLLELNIKKLREDFKEPHHLLKASDEATLFIREWKPSSPSKVSILIFHGITGYSGAYSEMVAIPLAKAGFSIFGLDLRGHGLSDGNRGDLPSKDRLVKDLCEAISFVKEKAEKVIVLGHSLGVVSAIIATNYCPEKIDGLILLSAGRTVREGAYKKMSPGTMLKILFSSMIKPSKPVITYSRDGISGLDDPLRTFKYTFRFMKILNAKALKFPEKLDLPVIIGVGDQDELFEIDSPKALLEEIPSTDKTFIVIKGAKHAEFPAAAWNDLVQWLNKKFK